MSSHTTISDAFWPLLNAACDGTLLDTQFQDLETFLASDATRRRIFVDHMYLRRNIRSLQRSKRICDAGLAQVAAVLSQEEASNSASPFPAFFPSPLPDAGGSFFSFSSGWPVAYLIATVIFGVGALIGAFTYVSHRGQVAMQSPTATMDHVVMAPQRELVGRITGMVDCQWADPQNTPATNAVRLGDRYALASGLMQITFDTGAKVLLQGPVTYEVELKNGGFLPVGKLTGKVEDRTAQGFSVRTPTAVVTDLGTEFGVEVSKTGDTTAHVFGGVVEVQLNEGSRKTTDRTVRLTENESLLVEKRPDGMEMKVRHGASSGAAFVRVGQLSKLAEEKRLTPLRRWQAYSQQLRKDPALLAYYTFEGAEQGNLQRLPNVSLMDKALDGRIDGGADWVYGRLPGKYALYFHGPGSGDKVVLPEPDRFNFAGPFSVAVWFKVERLSVDCQRLVVKSDLTWRLQRNAVTNSLAFFTDPLGTQGRNTDYRVAIGQTDVVDGRWHLTVAVYEPTGKAANVRLYMDGRLEGEAETLTPLNRDDNPVCLGGIIREDSDLAFCGRIDEVAIFTRALSANEVAAMHKAGNPAGPLEGESNKEK